MIGAIFASIGYLAKELVDRRKEKETVEDANISNLESLSNLLLTMDEVFHIQCEMRNRLSAMLKSKFPNEVKKYVGFDEKFSNLYDKFSPEEMELYGIIRGLTENSILYLNKSTQKAVRIIKTKLFKIRPEKRAELDRQLHLLDLHLTLWLAKYEYWIPGNPKHAFVYMADEKMHGIGFPREVRDIVDEVLTDLH